MRVNIYAEEMTDRIEIIGKEIEGHTYTGLRLYLELPVTLPDGSQAAGPFMHRPGDDDSAAITFWGKRDLRAVLRKMLAALDEHYGDASALTASGNVITEAGMRMLKEAWPVAQAQMRLDAGSAPAADTAQCWCETCRPITMDDMRMVLCPTCGNKRCPHATDHRNTCTGSNEPGQQGSAYEHCQRPAEDARPVGEVQRGHYGGRAGNIGFQQAVLYPEAKVMDGTKLYAIPQLAPPVEFMLRRWLSLGRATPGNLARHLLKDTEALLDGRQVAQAAPIPLDVIQEWAARRIKACGPAGVTDQIALLEDAVRWAEGQRSDVMPQPATEDDTARLDFLDSLNAALNANYSTTYRWKLVLSPNVTRLMVGSGGNGHVAAVDLHDSDAKGLPSCRQAIDEARANIAKGVSHE